MESLIPPGFTSDDTSQQELAKIPSLSLGLSKWLGRKDAASRSASFRQTDISGAYISKRLDSQILTVILNPSQIKNTPSKKSVGDKS